MIRIRSITFQEEQQAKKFWRSGIPVAIVLAFILYVLYAVKSIPNIPKYAGFAICIGAFIIFFWKYYLLQKDLKKGEVKVVEGVLDKKRATFSGSRSRYKANKIKTPHAKNSTFILTIEGESYRVKRKHYIAVEEGNHIKLCMLPSSKFVLSVK